MEYRYGSHTVFQIEYYFVWVTKYRYKVSGELSTEHGAERDHEAVEGPHVVEAVRRVSAREEAVLGSAFLGERVFLCHGRPNDGRDDQAVFGTSL